MKILINTPNAITKNSVCAIGSFDGVHRGHQRIVRFLKRLAYPRKKVGILTFLPLPFFVLHKAPICCLTPKKEKEVFFKELGVDFIYYFKFTKEFSRLSPTNFVELIAKEITPSTIVVGKNFHFGRNRQGSANFIKKAAGSLFRVKTIPILKDEGIISSTRIRELLLLGHIKAANRLLGREYRILGMVMKGKGKGKRLGFPTINIRVQEEKLLPLDGVYKVKVGFDKKELIGAMFCRHNLIEVHLINFAGDLYKKEVTLKLIKRIRDIKEFPDDETLKTAIAADVKKIKK